MAKSYFVVLLDMRRREVPCIYVDGIPLHVKGNIVWGVELKTDEARSESIDDLYRMYRIAEEMDNLMPNSLKDRDFYTAK